MQLLEVLCYTQFLWDEIDDSDARNKAPETSVDFAKGFAIVTCNILFLFLGFGDNFTCLTEIACNNIQSKINSLVSDPCTQQKVNF